MKSLRTVGTLVVALLVATALLSWPGVAAAVQLTIDADTFVNSASINQNNGTSTTLKVSPTLTTYLKFDFTTLPPGTPAADIQKATLTFYVTTVTTHGPFHINPVANGWIETGVTFANTPPPSATPSSSTSPSSPATRTTSSPSTSPISSSPG